MPRSNKKSVPATAQLLDGRFDLSTLDGISRLRHATLRLYLQGEITRQEHDTVKQALAEARKDFEVKRRGMPPLQAAASKPTEEGTAMPDGYSSDGPFGVFSQKEKSL